MSKALGSAEGSPQSTKTGAKVAEPASEGGSPAQAGLSVEELAKKDKRIEDLERMLSETTSNRDKLKAKNEELTGQVLKELAAAASKPGSPEKSEDEIQREYKALAKQISESVEAGDGQTILDIVNAYAEDSGTRAQKKALNDALDELKKRDERIEALENQVRDVVGVVRDSDPNFVARREQIQELAEVYELDPVQDRKLLMKIAEREKPDVQPRAALPGSLTSSRISSAEDDSGDAITEGQIAFLKKQSPDLTEEEIRNIAKRLKNAKNGRSRR